MRRPNSSTARHCSSLYGLVTRGDSTTRCTLIACSNVVSHSSSAPVIGAALTGCGVQASGMWPSPASKPEVGSRPTQPAPGQIDLGPRMQVREVALGARRPVERLHVGDELDQIARHETARESQVPQDVHEQPARVAARARAQLERLLGRLHAGLHADRVGDLALQAAIELDEKVDGPRRRLRAHRFEPALHERPGRLGVEVRLEVLAQDRLVDERKLSPLRAPGRSRTDCARPCRRRDRPRRRTGSPSPERRRARGSCRADPAASSRSGRRARCAARSSSTGVRLCGAGRRRTTCGPICAGRSYS